MNPKTELRQAHWFGKRLRSSGEQWLPFRARNGPFSVRVRQLNDGKWTGELRCDSSEWHAWREIPQRRRLTDAMKWSEDACRKFADGVQKSCRAQC